MTLKVRDKIRPSDLAVLQMYQKCVACFMKADLVDAYLVNSDGSQTCYAHSDLYKEDQSDGS